MLRADAWERLFRSKRDGQPLVPILALCGDENGESLLGIPPDEEDSVMEEAAEFIPACVAAIDAYWRAKRQRQASMPLTAGAKSAATTRALAAPGKNSKNAAAKLPKSTTHSLWRFAEVFTGCVRRTRLMARTCSRKCLVKAASLCA